MIEFHFFGMPIKTLGSLGKIRVGRVTGNTHFFFFGPMSPHPTFLCPMKVKIIHNPSYKFSYFDINIKWVICMTNQSIF